MAQTPKSRDSLPSLAAQQQQRSKAPYALLWEQLRRRRKQHHHHVHLDDVEDDFSLSCEQQQYDNYIMEDEEEVVEAAAMDGDFLFPSALDYIDRRQVYDQLHSAKQFELQARRRASRKHCRRKWAAAQAAQLTPAATVETGRCSRLVSGVLERTQQELQRLRSEL